MRQLILFILLTSFSLQANQAYWLVEETPLMLAAAKGDIAEMKKCIQSGANANAVIGRDQPHGGKPVLRYAIDSHSLQAVQVLIEAGANVNDITESPLLTKNRKSNIRNLSLLSHAIRSKAPLAIIKELVQNGADVDGNPKVYGDWSALMIAAYVGYTEAVVVLLAAGADKDAVNNMDNKTALDYAQEQGHKEIAVLLKSK